MALKKKYFISPISINEHDLMDPLTKKLSRKGYKIICRNQKLSINYLVKNKRYISTLKEILSRVFWKFYIYFFVLFVSNSKIIIAWPQITGFNIVFKSIKRNKVILYIMDNSFFCIRSYNIHPVKNTECLDCLGSINTDELCMPFPVKYDKLENIEFLNKLKKVSNKIIFYSQNNLQKILLEKHFGKHINVKVVGMNIGKLKQTHNLTLKNKNDYDVVFHAKSIKAKGLNYVIQLAESLPEIKFLIPDTHENVANEIGPRFFAISKEKNLPMNITFEKMDWSSGLREKVISARLVINPSIWSAPIESALIKSAALNKNVATVESNYGYEKEIKEIQNHIRLSRNINIAAKQVKNFFDNIK